MDRTEILCLICDITIVCKIVKLAFIYAVPLMLFSFLFSCVIYITEGFCFW